MYKSILLLLKLIFELVAKLCMTCSVQLYNQLTSDIFQNILSCALSPYSVTYIQGNACMDRRCEDSTLLRHEDIEVFHRWLVGDLPFMITNQKIG